MKDLNCKPYHHHHTSYHPYHMQQNVQQHAQHNTNHMPNDFQQQTQSNQQQQNTEQLFNYFNATQQSQQCYQHTQQQQQQLLQRQHHLLQQQLTPTHPNYHQAQQFALIQRQHSGNLLIKGNDNDNNHHNINTTNNNNSNSNQNYNGTTVTSCSTTNATYTAVNSNFLQQQFCNKNYNNFLANSFCVANTNNNLTHNYNNGKNNNNNNNTHMHNNNGGSSGSNNNDTGINRNNYLNAATTMCNSLAQMPQQQLQQYGALDQFHTKAQSHITDCITTTDGNADKFTMDANEIVNFIANELLNPQLVSVDGIQSGVPTLTTPTLTPTTLRSIEETFVNLTSEPINLPNQAGFKPPPLAQFHTVAAQSQLAFNTNSPSEYNDQHETASEDSRTSWNGQFIDESSQATTDNSSAATDTTSMQNGLHGMGNNSLTATSTTSSTNNDFKDAIAAANAFKNGHLFGLNTNGGNDAIAQPTSSRSAGRRGGGRRPTQPTNMSPEEEEKRRLRRERNKLAAARCRKRRVDQTNELLEEVSQLEKKREQYQNEITNYTKEKEELQCMLEAHRPHCKKMQSFLSVTGFADLMTPTSTTSAVSFANTIITGIDTTLASTGRSISPLDLKPDILNENVLQHIKNEPLDHTLDSSSSDDRPTSPKCLLPNVATLQASIALNTPIMTTTPVSFSNYAANSTLNALNKTPIGVKPTRPNTLPGPRNLHNLALHVDGKPPTEINGVSINTPSNGFNFESLMDGGTGLTPTSGPLMPTCSSQNKSPLELTTPTSEPSKLVSL